LAVGGLTLLGALPALGDYVQTNIISDIASVAPNNPPDPNLKNPWGMSFSTMSPFWVSNQVTSTATLYNPMASPVKQGLTVAIQTNGVGSPPTGQVFNSTTSDFQIPAPGGGTVKATFLFDTLDGTIQGWNPGSSAGMNASVSMATVAGAHFTGLTLANFGGANFLYAADASGHIDVFDAGFHNVTNTTFAGKFVDPNPVGNFTPFNIQLLNGSLYVTYASAGPMGAPLPGGYVDQYDTAGNFIARIATNGPLNSPWGLTFAPAGTFGPFSGDLLIGNLFDSKINAWNPTTKTFDGSITVATGFTSPVGLWALAFGNGVTGNMNTLYFTSGINNQADGLFGSIVFIPEPGSGALIAIGALAFGAYRVCRRRSRPA
jgi:uncharacterized protein (TIGR03118 family)